MPVLLGAHMSIAGGLPRAVDRAVAHGCRALQIFSRSSMQWRARALDRSEVAEFRDKAAGAGLGAVVAHASYLINLASGDRTVRTRSRAALLEEVDRAEALELQGVVLHPGCATRGGEGEGIRRVAEGIEWVLEQRPRGRAHVILELTAGQGTSIGHRFEHLAAIIDRLHGSPRLGVCLDTCHLYAAGYDIGSAGGYEASVAAFDATVGLGRLELLHLNDSRRPLGSRVDRHEHIGRGFIGLEPFRRLLNDARLAGRPMVIETPKTDGLQRGGILVDPLDRRNLRTLRALVGPT
jgi:deoxyribonuclease-4